MATWLVPALKAVLPHVGSIISAALPVFTRRRDDVPEQQVLQQQIEELQAAATRNAEHVKDLAAQLQQTVAALEEAALLGEQRLRRLQAWCGAAIAVSLLAIAVGLFALAGT